MSMRAFAHLLDRLSLTSSRNAKLRLVRDYLATQPDPERGWALATLTGALTFDAAKPAMIRKAVEGRVDPQLFWWSYDYVGDLAETVALVWPRKLGANREPDLSEVVDALRGAHRRDTQGLLEGWLDACDDADARWALLKLLTGGLRVGLSARLAKQAAADMALQYGHTVEVGEIEEVWHALEPPYPELFAWLEGRAPKPEKAANGLFRPVMLAHAIEDSDLEKLDPADYAVEWKWDGIRVQVVAEGGVVRLYSRTGDDIAGAFPDLADAVDFTAVLDGELLVGASSATGTFSGELDQGKVTTVDLSSVANTGEYAALEVCNSTSGTNQCLPITGSSGPTDIVGEIEVTQSDSSGQDTAYLTPVSALSGDGVVAHNLASSVLTLTNTGTTTATVKVTQTPNGKSATPVSNTYTIKPGATLGQSLRMPSGATDYALTVTPLSGTVYAARIGGSGHQLTIQPLSTAAETVTIPTVDQDVSGLVPQN